MNKDILFRGKKVNDGTWVEGAYFQGDDGCSYIRTGIAAKTPIDETAMCITHQQK